MPTDPIALAQTLIRCPSVTPEEGGALNLCEHFLIARGFRTWRLPFGNVDNLFARWGTQSPHLCFAGHTDVVSVGSATDWSYPPFSGTIVDDVLFGRGAEDMKGNVAAALAAAGDFLDQTPNFAGSLSFLLTGDEEGLAVNGTKRVLQWMASENHIPDSCLVIEPTADQVPGDTLKIGRRGSMNATLSVAGTQGHVAYPEKANNPLPHLIQLLSALITTPLDAGTQHFEPSNLQLISIDVGNSAFNLIPAKGNAKFNVRFNELWTPETLESELNKRLKDFGVPYDLDVSCNALAFMTPPDKLALPLAAAVESVTGQKPMLSTAGGTSDARFIQTYCPVVEMGLVGRTMHQIDEHVLVDHIITLQQLYHTSIVALTL